eukprot:Sspe_Gene.87000::Locus_57848_Transcript_1_1_Confidence_1.000_Length_1286::g.87000::m.87000
MEIPSPPREAILGPRSDVVCIHLPALLSVMALASFPVLPTYLDDPPFILYVVVVIGLDMGHTFTTFFHAHFDSRESRRRKLLYWGAPLVVAFLLVTSMVAAESATWVTLGYLSMAHVVQQQLRMLWITNARGRCLDDQPHDTGMVLVGALCPIVLWHADPDRKFDWFFRHDDIPLPLPGWSVPVAVLVWAGALVVHIIHYSTRPPRTLTKHVFLVGVAASWAVGVLLPNKPIALLSLTASHSLQSIALSFLVLRDRHSSNVRPLRDPFLHAVSSRLWLYMLCLFGAACAEELLWEALLWREWTPHFSAFDFEDPSEGVKRILTAFLLLPTVLHYFFDCFVWSHTHTPSLLKHLGLEGSVQARYTL